MTTVAILGTGVMGAPMARNALAAGLAVRAWNRTAERAQALAGDGAAVAATPAAAAEGADLVATVLSDADATLHVMLPPGGALAGAEAGAVWVQMGTLGLEGTERCAALAAQYGVPFVDAPVMGTKQPAEQGALTVLASGSASVRETVAPLFEAVGARTLWLGEAGAGTRMKLVGNAWVLALVEGLAETFALAEGLGVDPRDFLDVIAGGPLDAGYAHIKGGAMIEREFAPSFPLRLAAKDARLIAAAAEQAGLELPVVRALVDQLAAGVERGHGDEDVAATFRMAAGDAGA
jgi:3-hydroxyisobutyrate dehydrogenase